MEDFTCFEVCRVCATPKTNATLTSLFGGGGEKAKQLKLISGIDVTIDEGKRCAMICNSCSKRLKQALIFRSEIIDSEEQYFKIIRDEEEASGSKELTTKEEGQEAGGSGEMSAEEQSVDVKQEIKATKSKRRAAGKQGCDICHKTFTSKARLRYHLSSAHAANGRFQCDLCPIKFVFKSHLELHFTNHRRPQHWHQCKEKDCGRFLQSEFHLKQHMVSHSNVRPFVCWCARAFKFEHSLHFHQRRLHPEAEHFRHKCPLEGCLESFDRVSDLHQHFLVHHPGYRPFKCSTCGKLFKNRCQMYAHHRKSHPR